MDFKNYKVKNVKIFNGREGQGFNAILYNGTKKIAEVINDAGGGETMFHFYPDTRDEEHTLREHCKSLPKVKLLPENDKLFDITPDWFIEELINEYQKEKDIQKIKKTCQKKTLYRLNGEQKGQYYICNIPYDLGVKMSLERKFGDSLAEIINETLNDNRIPEIF